MIKSAKKQSRRSILMELVCEIESGEFRHRQIDLNKLYELHNSVRHEYQNPKDVSSKNNGQTMIWDY
ncbi:MAG: hypothetical protein Q8P20_00585 [bacterium]|nr:hypothetical protein [bacterium]